MARARISKELLDKLIRAKLAGLPECAGLEPLPVAWRPTQAGNGSNWVVPGWAGDAKRVDGCVDAINAYLRVLESQFEIPDER